MKDEYSRKADLRDFDQIFMMGFDVWAKGVLRLNILRSSCRDRISGLAGWTRFLNSA
jgi:hypothetical protein